MACINVYMECQLGAPAGESVCLLRGRQDVSTIQSPRKLAHGDRVRARGIRSSRPGLLRGRVAAPMERLHASYGRSSLLLERSFDVGMCSSGTEVLSRFDGEVMRGGVRTGICSREQWPGAHAGNSLGAVKLSRGGASKTTCRCSRRSVIGGRQWEDQEWRKFMDISTLQDKSWSRSWHRASHQTAFSEGKIVAEGSGRGERSFGSGDAVEEGETIVDPEGMREARMKYLRGGMMPKIRKRVESFGEVDGENAKVFSTSKGGSGKTVKFLEKLQTGPAQYIVEEDGVQEERLCDAEVTDCSLSEFLSIMRRTQGLPMYSTDLCFTVTGEQVMFEMDAKWVLTWCMDGRVRETFDCPEVTFDWGLDAMGTAWEADASGHISRLDLDDHDLAVLTAWIRSGYWLTAEARSRLQIEFLSEEGLEKLKDDFNGDVDSYKFISVCVPGRNVKAVVIVDKSTCLPKCMRLNVFGTYEVWDFDDWTRIIDHCPFLFPVRTHRHPTAGGDATYTAKTLQCVSMFDEHGNKRSAFSHIFDRPSKPLPRHNERYPRRSLNPDSSEKLTMMLTDSRHNVVRPLVNGKDVGYFMIDTGASGLTISPDLADSLGMGAFGRLHVTGVQGSMDTQYRVGESFELGPLHIENPIFMEVENHGVIQGPAAVGICGYDIFRDCIVEMSQMDQTISFYDRNKFMTQNHGETLPWQELYLIGNVPHAKVSVDGVEELFLIDTGAGGTDIIFHFRAVEKHNLMATHKVTSGTSLRGMGGDTDGLSVVSAKMKNFRVGRHVIKEVSALFSLDKVGGVDLSEYTAGILCGDLLRQFQIVYDYGGRRIAFLPERKKGRAWRVMAMRTSACMCRCESLDACTCMSECSLEDLED